MLKKCVPKSAPSQGKAQPAEMCGCWKDGETMYLMDGGACEGNVSAS
jgi:hypothetical protein